MSRSSSVSETDLVRHGIEDPASVNEAVTGEIPGPYAPPDRNAWRELRREVLDDGLERWPLPVPWTEVGAVNCYLVREGDHVVLIDPGWSIPEGRTTLDRYLHEADLHHGDIVAMVSTHHHADHITQAFDLRREYGIPLLAGRDEAISLRASMDEQVGFAAQLDMLRGFGGVDLAEQAAHYRSTSPEAGLPTGLADQWLDDGDRLDLVPSGIEIIGTPGHTRGHVSVRLTGDRVVSGDHLLPMIPTSSGLERTPEEFPLSTYLASLRRVLAQPDARLLPAHGHVLDTVHRRAVALLDHHERRLDQVRSGVEDGQPSALEVAVALPWTRRERTFGTLPVLRRISALMEIGVHLDELVLRDELRLTVDRHGVRRYRRITHR